MLAYQETRSLVEQLSDAYQFTKPLPVLSSYSAFVPNKIFNTCSPSEVMVYAAIQYLSFFDIKCSTPNIAKNLNASSSTIRNALNSLSKEQQVLRQQNGTFLFKNHCLGHPKELLTAKELTNPNIGYGYWFPVEILKSKKMSNQTKKAFAVMKSLTYKKEKKIDMNYIASKLGISRSNASPLIQRLLTENLISRDRPHVRSTYIYQTGANDMSIYKQDLPTGAPTTGALNDQCTENRTSKCTENRTSLSIKRSNIFLRDKSKDQRDSGTYQSGQEKSFFVLKETVEFLIQEIEHIAEPQSQEEEVKNLNDQYTQACVDHDIEKIQELRAKMSVHDVQTKRDGQTKINTEKTKAILSDHQYCLKRNQSVALTVEQIKQIGSAVKEKVKAENYADPKKRNRALCLLFNSIFLDIKSQHPKSLRGYPYQKKDRDSMAMTDSVDICIKRMATDDYGINPELVPQILKDRESLSAAHAKNDDRYSWIK